MTRGSYNTKYKELVIEKIKSFSNGFTIKELKEELDNSNIKVGLTTLYRLLDKLEGSEIVTKYFDSNTEAHYKYVKDCVNEKHFYLKCYRCEKIIHADCSCIDELSVKIYKDHSFLLDTKNIVMFGVCKECNSFIKLR